MGFIMVVELPPNQWLNSSTYCATKLSYNAYMSMLAADLYYFNSSKHFDKASFIRKDVEQLVGFFSKSEEEIFEASKSYIGREEHLYLFVSAIKFWRNAIDVQLTDRSTNLSTLVMVFSTEAILGNQIKGNGDRFRNFILNFLSKEEKIELVSGYTFGRPYAIGEGGFRKKHLCYRAAILSDLGRYYDRKYCTSGELPLCICRDWLDQASLRKVNYYLNIFGSYFYKMRNSVVHDAGFVQFTSMPFYEEGLGDIIPTMVDAFSDHKHKQYTSYDTDITINRFHEIMKEAAWRCFSTGSKIRLYKAVPMLKRL